MISSGSVPCSYESSSNRPFSEGKPKHISHQLEEATSFSAEMWFAHFFLRRSDSLEDSASALQTDTAVACSAEISSCVLFPGFGRFMREVLHICISELLSLELGQMKDGRDMRTLGQQTVAWCTLDFLFPHELDILFFFLRRLFKVCRVNLRCISEIYVYHSEILCFLALM